jgi:hypothetical protein
MSRCKHTKRQEWQRRTIPYNKGKERKREERRSEKKGEKGFLRERKRKKGNTEADL